MSSATEKNYIRRFKALIHRNEEVKIKLMQGDSPVLHAHIPIQVITTWLKQTFKLKPLITGSDFFIM